MNKPSKITTIRIPQKWHYKLLEIANIECRSINSMINQAIREFLEKHKALD